MTPDLDVILPTCDRPVELATTLAGLAAQDVAFSLVLSDQSTDRASYDTPPAQTLLSALRRAGHPVQVGRHLPRRGLAEHRAAMLARCSARYVLLLDDDIWLEPGALGRLHEAIVALGCGMVGAPVQALSYVDDERPAELAPFERWEGPPVPERIEPDTPEWARWTLHNAANAAHLAERHLRPGERWLPYKIAWIAGCVLFDRAVLDSVGGFEFWREIPEGHSGEDVLVQHRVIARAGGAGILPSGAYHLESPTTVPDRSVQARSLLGLPA